LKKVPGTITVHVGTPLDTTGRDPRELTETASRWVHEKLSEMQPSLYDPQEKGSNVEVGDR
jgi:hypothetical protein